MIFSEFLPFLVFIMKIFEVSLKSPYYLTAVVPCTIIILLLCIMCSVVGKIFQD